ncbi:MAG TPA: DNA polymerase III subunit gamma and tau, partial [Motilibacteraceae bacterium]|nr:DNA polymerase III subunit gamma and tau [Motilibacteraceae bacterium]
QEHVTEPLMQALRNDRVNHAYLFSGPRGCGKTTSARILARSLNCEQGPTPEPCGVCDSCVALARGGPGSIDVIEIDAASHGGVDDARDLREKAFFAPASSRYKIYIVDEAHMVTTSGFNALLKIVEEPPPHLKFIFATTEPDKVIGTIRSRTHHYPFRLVPPGRLQDYLAQLCGREGVDVAKGVLPLVVRAGRGSVRDSLSVLDQLMAGAGPDGVTYALATSLLGFTDAALLDDAVEAFAAGDGAAVFHVVDRVIEAGHDPKRFAEDLLERLRDLIVIAAVPDAAATILDEVPADQLERMRSQAALFGAASLSRAADILATGLTEMRGATAPRLQLELMCARVLLPAAHDDERSLQARLDRMERRLSMGGVPSGGGPGVAGGPTSGPAAARAAVRPAPAPVEEPPAPDEVAAPHEVAAPGDVAAADRVDRPDDAPRPAEHPLAPTTAPSPAAAASAPPARAAEPDDPWAVPAQWTSAPQGPPARPAATPPAAAPSPAAASPAAAAPAEPAPAPAPGGLDVGAVRGLWTEVLSALAVLKRATWTLVSQNAKVADLAPGRLTLAFSSAGLRDAFARGVHPELVRQALIDVLGLDVQVEAIVDPSAAGGAGGTPPRAGAPLAPPPAPAPSAAPRPAATRPQAPAHPPATDPDPSPAGLSAGAPGRPRAMAEDDPSLPPEPPEDDDPWAAPSPRAWAEGSARAGAGPDTRPGGARPAEPARSEPARRWVPPEQDVVSDDDPDADDSGLSGAELLVRELGATVIEEREEL